MTRCLFTWAIWLNFAGGLAVAEEDWPLEKIHLRGGTVLAGLVETQADGRHAITLVFQKPGLGRWTVPHTVDAAEIDRIDRLPVAERRQLADRLAELERARAGDQRRRAAVVFKEIPGATGGVRARQFPSKYFTIESDLSEATLREVVVRLEDLFAALTERLKPRSEPAEPLRLVLFSGLPQFLEWQKKAGLALHGLAYYHYAHQTVVAGSDVDRYARELEKVKHDHRAKYRQLDDYLVKLKQHYGGKPPLDLLHQVRSIRLQMHEMDQENQVNYEQVLNRFLGELAHQTVCGYLATSAYRGDGAQIPRWVCAGLGQIAAQAVQESGRLTLGSGGASLLALARTAARKGELTAIAKLLSAAGKTLDLNHPPDPARQDRDFLTAWALAQYVFMERQLLGTAAMDDYIRRHGQASSPQAAFEALVGQPLAEFEKQFHDWVAGEGKNPEL
jgi:hypothetical protein